MRSIRWIAGSAAAVALTVSACVPAARWDEYGTDYAIDVYNPHPHTMNVSALLGANATTALGPVDAGETMRFAIRNPNAMDIKIIATGGGMRVEEDAHLRERQVVRVELDDD